MREKLFDRLCEADCVVIEGSGEICPLYFDEMHENIQLTMDKEYVEFDFDDVTPTDKGFEVNGTSFILKALKPV